MDAAHTPERRDTPWLVPWPSLQQAWHDPPWSLSGRVLTAWFTVPWDVVTAVMSPSLLPRRSARVRTRLRFYEISFKVLQPSDSQPLAPTEGKFHEAAVGFPASVNGVDGEVSLFLWADSETYVMWAREAFGWPVVHGRIALKGTIWSAMDPAEASGGAELHDSWGSAAISGAVLGGPSGTSSPAACWFTPRRILKRAGLDGEDRQLLAVRPRVQKAGILYGGSGRVRFSFTPPHPLAGLPESDAELNLVDGFELVVGEDVELI